MKIFLIMNLFDFYKKWEIDKVLKIKNHCSKKYLPIIKKFYKIQIKNKLMIILMKIIYQHGLKNYSKNYNWMIMR